MKKFTTKAIALALGLVTLGVILTRAEPPPGGSDIGVAITATMASLQTNSSYSVMSDRGDMFYTVMNVSLMVRTNIAYGDTNYTILATNFGLGTILECSPMFSTNPVWSAIGVVVPPDGSRLYTFAAPKGAAATVTNNYIVGLVDGATNVANDGTGTNLYTFTIKGTRW